MNNNSSEALLKKLREGAELGRKEKLLLIMNLSLPAMLAQLSFILMEYIDASMVGQLGPEPSAAIGLVSTSTWLFGGLSSAAVTGFTVQAAQQIGARNEALARKTVRTGIITVLLLSFILMTAGLLICRDLPHWLGGTKEICADASAYFMIYSYAIPFIMLNSISGGMLQSSGNMKLPSLLNTLMCGLDVVFNMLLIFPSRQVSLFGAGFWMPGADMGAAGAALGTGLAEAVIAVIMCLSLSRAPFLTHKKEETIRFSGEVFIRACRIAIPVAFEQTIMCGAYVAGTRIVSPLGNIAIAANSFAVTAESLCYMPGYGLGAAASTMVGQSIGAGRQKLSRQLGWITTGLGMAVMGLAGCLMFLAAPFMIGLLSPDPSIRELGAAVLRIEAFAEPLYGASIIASGVFRGAGDTLVPSAMSFISMWCVRIPLSIILASKMGLHGVWLAMCLELCFRGTIFLVRLKGKRWMKKISY